MFEPARHEPLIKRDWKEHDARAAIESIVQDSHARFDPRRLWAVHPLDRPSAEIPLKMLYFGAAGVIWALDYLNRTGATSVTRDYRTTLAEMAVQNRDDLNLSEPNSFSYLMGDAGIQLVHWRIDPSAELADVIYRAVERNTGNPAREFMWGAPGTMLAALFMYEFTAASRWKDLYARNAARILGEMVKVNGLDCYTWSQDLYGQTSLYLGAVHGFAANIFSIVRGHALLDPETIALVGSLAADTFEKTATVEADVANWPADLRGGNLLVQHCHGAPGMITCLAELPAGADARFDHLLEKGGELIWRAGPLTKGSNLCHGTAGNGYAFLKLYRRTGDAKWLERARAFAMHAIAQSEQHAAQYGRRRYSLYTGDLGLAVYLWDCIKGEANFPTLDVF